MQIFKLREDISNRDFLGSFLNEQGLTGTGVEVGVNKGENAKNILRHWHGSKLYLVDPWRKLDDYNDTVNKNFDPNTYSSVKIRFAKYGERVEIIKAMSHEAAKVVPNDLDFVYIDANHAYEYVKQDIELWYPKVKSGGILSGHDLFFPGYLGATNAVIELALAKQIQVHVIRPTQSSPGRQTSSESWFVFKP